MQKVWILEKFFDCEELENRLVDAMEQEFKAKQEKKSEDEIKILSDVTNLCETNLRENPIGYWSGQEGKSNYRQFCEVAQENLRRNKGKGYKFRVIEAEVEDNATMWWGYKFIKENEGVLKYLYATL